MDDKLKTKQNKTLKKKVISLFGQKRLLQVAVLKILAVSCIIDNEVT